MQKVMIVDDSAAVRLEIIKILKEHYMIVEAVDGADAVQKAKDNKDIELVILDYNMPKMDGLSAAQRIRAQKPHSNTSMIMLTTESNTIMKQRAKEIGIIAWVVKPINAKNLMGVIDKIFERRSHKVAS